MGRYYYTANDWGGKFGFGIQSSTDPGDFFGMEERRDTIYYWASKKDHGEFVKKKLDELFDILEVEQGARKYSFEKEKELDEYLKALKDDKLTTLFVCHPAAEDGVSVGYYLEDEELVKFGITPEDRNKYSMVANDKKWLAFLRLRLGLVIMSELENDEICELEAECE